VTVAGLGHSVHGGHGRPRQGALTAQHNAPTTVAGADPRLPIRRSHPGPIIRAGVVSLWALGRTWREDPPLGVEADDPAACRPSSGRRETAPPPLRGSGPSVGSGGGAAGAPWRHRD
jgi:hypothetical protein